MNIGGELHRADAVMPNGTVVELQCSGISVDDIQTREAFYGRMIWVFDARDPYEKDRIDLRDRGKYHTFRWKHPRKSVAYTSAPRRLDFGCGLVLDLQWMSKETPCGGKGILKHVPELAGGHS